jgi:hypothetical protein
VHLTKLTFILVSESSTSLNDRTHNARQLRSRTSNDDEQMETNVDDEMYSRAREKHTRATEREHRHDIKEEAHEIPKSTTSNSAAVKIRRINDETSKTYDDEQLEMGVGLSGKKNKTDKKKDKQMNTKENDVAAEVMPIANEKKRQAEETRIERIRRLCEKRTVGDVLDMAKQAYYERQQKREQFKDYIERME